MITMATSMNRWPVDPKTRKITVNGRTATVRKGPTAKLLRYHAHAWHRTVEPVTTFNGYRSAQLNATTGTPHDNSNHRSATATDINGYRYPYEYTHRSTYRNPMTPAQIAAVRAILRKIPELRWGADFNAPYRDPMHTEIRTGVTKAQLKRRVRALGIGKRTLSRNAWLFTRPGGGRKYRTRRLCNGRTVQIVYIEGKWAMTAKGDWIRTNRLK